jgi:hypothetical protein
MFKPLPPRSNDEQKARRACAAKEFMPKDFTPKDVVPNDFVPKHKNVACVELITTAALALSTAVAVTAVSIGIARADVIGTVAKGDSAPFAIALFIGLLLSAMGGLTALLATEPRKD